ncbi:MAG TPA: lipid II flippase MurJ, partial [Pirellulaceae bacterium]|nr:lipid II flippase MurJ [Pirellulaceae bacterium]
MTATGLTSGVPDPAPTIALPASQPQTSLRSISLVTGLTLLQLLLQFATQLVLAKYFGAAGEMDAYVAALALPVVIATILSGSLGYALVPVIAERLAAASNRDAATAASQIGLYLFTLSVVITSLVLATARPLMAILCPGFSADEQRLTADLLRISSLLIMANSLIAYLNALFHSYRHFARPALAGVVGTLVTFGYVVLLHDRQGIFAVAWGVVFGAAVTVAILAPLFVTKLWCSAAWKLPMQAGTRRCLWLLMPLVLTAIYWRLDPLLDRFLASRLPTGNIAHMGYAWRLISALTLIGTSGLSIVAFPAIAAHAAAVRRTELNAELAYALRFFLFLMVPVCVGLAGFAMPVVRLLFERGKFTAADTQAVALLVVLYVGAIFGAGLGDLLSRTFYSLHDMLVPAAISSVAFTLAAALKFLFVGSWGAGGLVAATSFYYLLNAGVLAGILLRRLSPRILAGTLGALVRAVVSSIAACLIAAVVIRLPIPAAILLAAGCGAIIYILVMRLLGD